MQSVRVERWRVLLFQTGSQTQSHCVILMLADIGISLIYPLKTSLFFFAVRAFGRSPVTICFLQIVWLFYIFI